MKKLYKYFSIAFVLFSMCYYTAETLYYLKFSKIVCHFLGLGLGLEGYG